MLGFFGQSVVFGKGPVDIEKNDIAAGLHDSSTDGVIKFKNGIYQAVLGPAELPVFVCQAQ